MDNLENPKLNTKWEQWCGNVRRGCPGSLGLIASICLPQKHDPQAQDPFAKGIGNHLRRNSRTYNLKLNGVEHRDPQEEEEGEG